jgi:hypothetical protein
MFVLFWSNLRPLLDDCFKLTDWLILDPIVFSTNQISLLQIFALLLHIFALLLQNFALLFEINCTEINQSQSSTIFIYIIIKEIDNSLGELEITSRSC